MPLPIHKRVGPYEILAAIGAGGMGDVYKARDTRLDRTVAIKVLSRQMASTPEAKARFEREAKTIAGLNHPHICTLYDVGEFEGAGYLVMEFLEGESLAQRLEKGALPLSEALRIAIEVADALDKAHRQKVTHRDLKPANIMLTRSGAKLLDFGLAKVAAESSGPSTLSALPTNAALTAEGTILGTLQYMAPEQLEGQDAGARTDIFAFGAVLYEMVTGRKAFSGKSQASLISAIMSSSPEPVAKLQPMTPPLLEHIVATCLAKNPDERWQTAADLERQLRWISENSSVALPTPLQNAATRRAIYYLLTAGLIAASSIVFLLSSIYRSSGAPAPLPTHIPFDTPPGVVIVHDSGKPGVAISPDGRLLVYAGSARGQRLYLQHLDGPDPAAPIAGTEGALAPFFSNDGKWLAFFANNKLQKVALSGGAPFPLAEAEGIGGGVWSLDDTTIYFVPDLDRGLWRVPSGGGMPVQITKPDRDGFDNSHLWPALLPGGNRLLYTSAYGRNRIMAVDLNTMERTVVVENGHFARFAPTGHLVFAQGHSLFAATFDPETLKAGSPVKILDNLVTAHEQFAEYALSPAGTLVYFDGLSDFQRKLVRIDRNGTRQQLATAKGLQPYDMMDLSGDGRRLAITLWEGQQDILIYDFTRDDFDGITVDPHNDFYPAWTPDGRTLAFASVRKGQINIYMVPADKSRPEELLYESENPKWPESFSPDGQVLAFTESRPGTGRDIWTLSIKDKKASPFREAPLNQWSPQFSPDGKWLAYQSDELDGKWEVYVEPYPGPRQICKISISGGTTPRWSGDGRELFYSRDGTAMVVDTSALKSCDAKPQPLFEGLEYLLWDVSPKGDFFVTLERREPPRLRMVLNWLEELKQRVPVN